MTPIDLAQHENGKESGEFVIQTSAEPTQPQARIHPIPSSKGDIVIDDSGDLERCADALGAKAIEQSNPPR
ncbi:hypothetical protein HK44_007930 [Pseudomonas fluorescens HK44]|uniref:Uncharacterized protein n=1 Tax=Pseudomonas fluorescens HK44 TaxID=1042209 RepID=A0A010RZI0_PSEFL|nr:hypothetical protein HK44_007930 [Pseudomonas fluorescens HK44]